MVESFSNFAQEVMEEQGAADSQRPAYFHRRASQNITEAQGVVAGEDEVKIDE